MIKRLIVTTALSTALFFSPLSFAADIVVAKVNGNPILKTDLEKFEKSLPPEILEKAKKENPDKLFSSLRDQAIDFELLSNDAEKADLDKDLEVQAAIKQMAKQIKLQAHIGKKLNPLVNDTALKGKYEEFLKTIPKNEEEVKIRHIMFKDEAGAKKAIEDLKGGADFQKIAREQSIDKSTAPEGGDLGFIRKAQVDKDFADAAFNLKSGQYTQTPVKSAMGWHVLKLEDRRKVKAPTFEEVKDQLGALVFQEQMKKLVDQLRDKASIERFDATGKAVVVGAAANDSAANTDASTQPATSQK